MVSKKRWTALVAALLGLLGGAAQVQAQEPAWKCVSRGSVTYSQVPCPGGTQVGARKPRRTDNAAAVPQDRATVARRAVLSPEDRAECKALDARIPQQEALVTARGEAATLDDEMPLVQSRRRFRELRC